jgi:hypothetical protein
MVIVKESEIEQPLKEGIKLMRRVVRDKPVYEYEIILLEKPTSFKTLCDLKYAFDQVENIVLLKKVEDKVLEAKKEVLDG